MRPSFLLAARDMTSTRIKICGISTAQDARAASDMGADAIGLVFYGKSPRAVSADQAVAIAAAVSPFVSVVALFVDEPVANIERILSRVPIDVIQFHGEESADYCQQFNRPWIKALRVKASFDIEAASRQYSSARGILLDSWKDGVPGGTGIAFDWELALGKLSRPIVLAGGLNEVNVAKAIETVRPAAVDVSGGVESSPGVKDVHKLRRFIAAVRAADQSLAEVTDDK
jgi:phosphoribosylanthranilate isomerase